MFVKASLLFFSYTIILLHYFYTFKQQVLALSKLNKSKDTTDLRTKMLRSPRGKKTSYFRIYNFSYFFTWTLIKMDYMGLSCLYKFCNFSPQTSKENAEFKEKSSRNILFCSMLIKIEWHKLQNLLLYFCLLTGLLLL